MMTSNPRAQDNASIPQVFCDKIRAAKVERARRRWGADGGNDADYLLRFVLEDLTDRISVANRQFALCGIVNSPAPIAKQMISACPNVDQIIEIAVDDLRNEENIGRFDLLICPITLHWINDIPGCLISAFKALKPDGLFLSAVPGDRTLSELKACLLQAETELSDSAAMRIEPFIDVRQAGSLLQRAGFALPVCDTEEVTVRFSSLNKLIEDLRSMGATSSMKTAMRLLPREVNKRTEKLYREKFSGEDGKIPATFSFVHMSGWHPHDNQQKPSKPGSATNQMSDFL